MISCELCGGPANWTFVGSLLYYHCQRQCLLFTQLDMFDDFVHLDSVGSVSALDEDEDGSDSLPW